MMKVTRNILSPEISYMTLVSAIHLARPLIFSEPSFFRIFRCEKSPGAGPTIPENKCDSVSYYIFTFDVFSADFLISQ